MNEIKYFKTENIIEDTCIMYGICSILADNQISFELIRQKNGYLLRYEDFDELTYLDYSEEEIRNANKTMRADEVKKAIKEMNEWINLNINNILLMLDSKNEYKCKTASAIGLGNNFYTYSYSKSIKIEEFRRYLALLGYLKYSTLAKYNITDKKSNDDMDLLLIPKEYSIITNIINLRDKKIDDEGNVSEKSYYFPDHTSIEVEAMIYLKTLLKLKRNRCDYEKAYITKNMKNSKKNSKDVFETINIKNWSLDLCEYFYNIIRNKNNDKIAEIVSKFILKDNISNFNKLIETLSKESYKLNNKTKYYLINEDIGDEIVNMYSEKIKKIYNSEAVKKVSKRLKNLLQHKKGYEILTSLYGVSNEKRMIEVVSNIIDTYDREKNKKDDRYKYYYSSITDSELLDIVNLLNDKEDAVIMAKAVIAYGKVYFLNNQNKEQIESEEI